MELHVIRRSRKLKGILALLAVCAWACASRAIAEDFIPRSYGESLVDRLFSSGSISFYFDGDIRAIAERYVSGTKYEGQIVVNDAPVAGAINLYVFEYNETLPRFLSNNCNAFPRDGLILCDRALLGSVPSLLPIAVNKDDPLERPILLQWIVAHEIGHLIFGDATSSFSYSAESRESAGSIMSSHGSPPNKPLDQWPLFGTDSFEVRADRFAIRGLEVNSSSTWLQQGTQLADAIFWEIEHLAPGTAKTKSYADELGQGRGIPKGPYELEVVRGSHPPMLVRLSNLLSEIISTYSGYPKDSGLLAPRLDIRIQYVRSVNSSDDTKTGLFFGGGRTTPDFSPIEKKHTQAERALGLLVHGHREYARGLLVRECNVPIERTEPWHNLIRLACILTGQGPSEDGDFLRQPCDDLSPTDAGRCLAVLLVLAQSCSDIPVPPVIASQCSDYQSLEAEFQRYTTMKLKYAMDARLLTYLPIAEYRIERQLLGGHSPEFSDWVARAVDWNASEDNFREALELNDLYLENTSGEVDVTRHLVALGRELQLEQRTGNIARSIAVGKDIVNLLDNDFPADYEDRASVRYTLGRLTRDYRVVSFGTNDALEFYVIEGKLSAAAAANADLKNLHSEETAVRKSSMKYLLEAADIFAAELKEETNTKKRDRVLVKYLNSLSGALFSYNTQSDTSDESIKLARRIRQELSLINEPPLKAQGYDFALECEAPALENIAVAEINSTVGDPLIAKQAAERSYQIREKLISTGSPEVLRTLAYAYYANNDMVEAKVAARKFLDLWAKKTGRRWDLNGGLVVHGEVVPFGRIADLEGPTDGAK
jgi:hypothetical protein